MSKKQVAVSLRKPPPADPDAFVAAAATPPPAGDVLDGSNPDDAAGSDTASGAVRARSRSPRRTVDDGPVIHTRLGPRRELIVHIPLEIARQLSARCAELDRDVSNFVADILASALSSAAPVEVTVPMTLWARLRRLLVAIGARLQDLARQAVPSWRRANDEPTST
jgi:hypothetical protein